LVASSNSPFVRSG